MKAAQFVLALLLASVQAHHKCDDVNTAAANALSSPLAKAVEKAERDKDDALAAKLALDDTLEGGLTTVGSAEEQLAQAEAALRTTQAKVEALSEAYQEKSALVAACKPDEGPCTIEEKNQLALQLKTAGEAMIDNDNLNQQNKNIFEQMTFEYNQAVSGVQFDQAAYNTKALRAIEDLATALDTYQNLKDQLEKHQVTGQEAQRSCMLEQFEDDMAEIERLEALLAKCKIQGCVQEDLDNPGLAIHVGQITGNNIGELIPELGDDYGFADEFEIPTINKKYHAGGVIQWPDCGDVMTSACYHAHYQSYWGLDFITFFSYFISIPGCWSLDTYEYDLCVANWASIITIDAVQGMAPYTPQIGSA